MSTQKEVRETLKLALISGLRVTKGTKHYKCYAPSGELVAVVPFSTGSGSRQTANTRATIKRSVRDAG